MSRLQIIAALSAVGATVALCALSPDQKAPKVDLPGITAKDPFPKGCVSCHIKTPDGQDHKLNVDVKKIKGHPDVSGMVKVVPQDCGICHKSGPKPAAMSTLSHKAHYAKKEASRFVKMFGGSCLACHSIDPATGKAAVKAGPKNW